MVLFYREQRRASLDSKRSRQFVIYLAKIGRPLISHLFKRLRKLHLRTSRHISHIWQTLDIIL